MKKSTLNAIRFRATRAIVRPGMACLLLVLSGMPSLAAALCEPPVVNLTAPTSGTSVAEGSNLTLSATSYSAPCSTTKVVFFVNGAAVYTDFSSPFSYAWNNVAAGSYQIYAEATNSDNQSDFSSSATVTVTSPVSVALTSPSNGSSAQAPATLNLAATASTSSGTISKVEFYDNGSLINTDTASPYAYSYGNVGAGSHVLTAKAYSSNLINTGVSSAVTVSVTGAPTVSITAPANGSSVPAPANLTLTATAADLDGISKVEFYANGALINTDTATPYSYAYTNVAAGNYAFTAKAYDNTNLSTVSAPVNVAVTANAPGVVLTSPSNGATATAPASFTLTATANANNGSIAKVEFFANGMLFATDTTSPYSRIYGNLGAGSYSFTAKATDTLGQVTTTAASTVTVTAPGASATRTYVYDANERLCKTINPESGATVIGYDAAGNIAWSADGTTLTSNICNRGSVTAGQKTVRAYDTMNRVTAVSTPGGTADLTTVYELDGLVSSLTAANPGGYNVTTTYAYNFRRLLTAETSNNSGAVLYGLGYGYNANGHLSELTYPDGQTVGYLPDALGRATKVGVTGGNTYASDISYFPNGAIRSFTYGNGVVHTMEHATNPTTQKTRQLPGRSLDMKGTTIILDDTYAFDQNGNVEQITDATPAGVNNRTRDLGYDGLDRLIVADAPYQWGQATYAYDAQDNLRLADQGTRKYRYNYDPVSNRLTTIKDPAGATQFTLGYDARGNTISKIGLTNKTLVFDAANRLNEVTGQQVYRYDGQGRRVQTTDVGSGSADAMYWIYSQSGQVLYTHESRRSRNLSYIYLGNTQVATRDFALPGGAETISYQHTDALGSIVAETNASGVVTKRNSYAPYGEAYGATVIDGTGYTGHVMDQATGLTYMQQRYYDPAIGRFLSVDPVVTDPNTGASFNRYNYANDNPYRFKDMDGRAAEDNNWLQGLGQMFVNSLTGGDTNSENQSTRTASTTMASNVQQSVESAVNSAKESIPTRHEVAVGADKVALNAGRVEVLAVVAGQPEVAAPAGAVSLGATAVALVAEPNSERAMALGLSVATAGASSGFKAIGEAIPAKSTTLADQVIDETKNATSQEE